MDSLSEIRKRFAYLTWLGSMFLVLAFPARPMGQQEEVGWLAFGAFCMVYVVIFIVWIILAIWVYRDARERGMSGGLWLLIVLITGIIGLIIYLVVRHDKQPQGYYPYPQQPYQQPYPQQPYQQPYQQPPQQQYGQQPPQQQYDPETGQYK